LLPGLPGAFGVPATACSPWPALPPGTS
jgi:hypothetical protein